MGGSTFTPPFAAPSRSSLPFRDSFLSSKAAFDVSFSLIVFFFERGGRQGGRHVVQLTPLYTFPKDCPGRSPFRAIRSHHKAIYL